MEIFIFFLQVEYISARNEIKSFLLFKMYFESQNTRLYSYAWQLITERSVQKTSSNIVDPKAIHS